MKWKRKVYSINPAESFAEFIEEIISLNAVFVASKVEKFFVAEHIANEMVEEIAIFFSQCV